MTTQEFIKKYRKRLVSGAMFYNPDTSLMSVESFYTAKCRILLCFPTPAAVKTVSSTAAAVNDYIIEHCPDTFIDFAYVPEGEDISLYDAHNMPYAIGNITHLDASHFDIIGFSISVLSDIIGACSMLRSFARCDKPVPLFWSERKNLSINECPIVYFGGITAVCADVCFGKVGDKEAFGDFMYLGSCEKTDVITSRLIEAKETGFCTRKQSDHDVPGYTHEELPDFIEHYPVNTVQDFVESLFDLQNIYQPQAYEVKFNKSRQIISNIKINPKARDFVTPYYPHIMHNDLGVGRTIINANGDMVGTAQTQVSEGCSAAGACSFAVAAGTRISTPEGLVKIEDYKGRFVGGLSMEMSEGVQKQQRSQVVLYKTKDGHKLRGDINHKFLVVKNDTLVEKRGYELHSGDVILRRLGSPDIEGRDLIDVEFAELLGFLHGDGCFANEWNRWKIYMSDGERPRYEYLFRKFAPSNYKTRIHYTGKKGNIWVIEAPKPKIDIDIADVPCSSLYVPDVIFKSSHTVRRAYLRGVFQADGWFNRVLGLTSISERFIDDVALLLSSLGIDSSVRKNGWFERHDEGRHPSFYLQVPKAFQQKFVDEIGFVTKNHEVSEPGNRTKANLFNTEQVVELVRHKYNCRDAARVAGVGIFYEVGKSKISDYILRQHKDDFFMVELSDSSVLKMVASGRFVTDRIDSVAFLDEESNMYDVVDTESSYCQYNDWLTHNCSEGNYTGGWVEKTSEQILKEVWETKKYNAGYKYKPYSFNANYITNYKGMLLEFIKIYPKVTFINMRMEELGRDPDAIKMMKLIGSNRISAPIEGLSPRVQNNLLNKCLSEESLINFMDDMVHQKMTDIKVGGIFTGYEEDEDFQWICDFVDRFKQRAAQEGGNFPMRLKCTPLVHYPLTPIEYIERKSAFRSYNGDRWLSDEWYEKFREHQVFFKVNGFRYSTFLEQSIVDLGRSLTPLMYEHFIKDSVPIYSLRTIATDEFIADLKKFIDPKVHFADRDPEHYISPCHRIHIELMGSYIPRARRLARFKKEGHIFDNPMDIRCLKTYDGAKTKCMHNCIVNEPLKIYNDVTMDENGELHGDYVNLTGCERCQNNEQRRNRLARPTPQTANSDDVIAAPRKPQVQKIRFVLRRNPDFDLLNPNNTAHTFMTKFLQLSDNLLHQYHSIVCHNLFWQAGPEFKYFTSGFQIVDTMWSANVIKEVRELIPQVNEMLQSVQVVSANDILRDDKLTITDYNVFYFETSLPKDLFDAARMNYKGDIKVESGSSMGFSLESIQDKSLSAPVYAMKGKTIGFFYIPAKYNPVVYMAGYLSTVKKMGFDAIVDAVEFSCVSTVRETSMICKNCGKEKALVSLSTGKPIAFGLNCLCKAFLTSKIKG